MKSLLDSPFTLLRMARLRMFCNLLAWVGLLAAGIPDAMAKSDLRVKFPEPVLQVEVGRLKIIPFLRQGKDPAAAQFEVKVTPAGLAEVILPAKILEQQPVGYLRIRPLQPGKATLQIGNASLALEIAPETSPKLVVEPRIVTPVAGAVVWGQIAVAAECFVPDGAATTAVLRLPDGSEVFPEPLGSPNEGPGRHFVFLVDTTHLKTGENDLQVEALLEGQAPIAAEPVRVRVIAPKVEELIAGECEATIETPRSEKYGLKTPSTRKDETASGGMCVVNPGPDPVWLTSVEVKEAGDYQMMIVSRGDAAVGAYPTMVLRVDDQQKPLTNGRVTDRVWRRTPLGLPVHLDVGQHTVGVRFDNDFYEAKVDRNLYLDRYELAKVAASSAVAAREGDGTMMMSPMMAESARTANGAMGFKVNFSGIFDGQSVSGPVTLAAKCRLDDANSTRFPEIGLWLNGRPMASENGPSLIFTIDPSALQPGKNIVQLRAQDSVDAWVESAPQSLFLDAPKPATGRQIRYFTVFDPGWDDGMQLRYEKTDNKRFTDTAAWYGNGESVLRLPDSLVGNYQLTLLARGQWFKGLPIAEIALRVNGQETSILKTEIKGEWGEIRPGALELPAGKKELAVRFINDDSDGGKGDRNFWLKWIQFSQSTVTDSLAIAQKPTVTLKYWPKDQPVGLTDAVVVDFFASQGLTTADLLIDDVPQNLAVDISNGLNPVVFPLLTRSLAAGSHRLKVIALDVNGKKIESESKEIRVSANRETSTGTYAKAVLLLDRLGFGAGPDDLASLLTLGSDQWLAASLSNNDEQRNALRAAVVQRFAGENKNDNLVRQVLYESVIDPNPVRQRFVLWAENHFSTWVEKTGREKKRREHEAFARIGVAPFPDLLLTSATSPAMLVYLDQQRSFAGRLNENYAREIMELHTLGVKGGYTQTDVTALAGLLTGWSMAEQGDLEGTGGDLVGEFRYDPALNSGAPAQILGLEFPQAAPQERFSRVQMALDTLASYPSTGEFISRKLLEHYVSDPAPPSLVLQLAQVYARTGGDMKAMLTALATSKEFLTSARRIATPLDFSLRVARSVGLNDTGAVVDFLRRSGMGLFDHTSPDGYSQEDANYVSSNALMQRWRFGQKIESQMLSLVPKSFRNEKKVTPEQTQRTLDLVATRLFGACLSDNSNRAAMDLLAKAEPAGDARSRLMVNFLCQTPEAGLR